MSLLLLGLTLTSSTLSVPLIQSAFETQPPSIFPIGNSGGANAKVSGRLFDIDGHVGYFAGKLKRIRPQSLGCYKSQNFINA